MEATLEIRNCHKRFPGVYALKDVSIEAYGGEIVALLGVNGAGKSTLMNVLGGVIRSDQGEILVHGERVHIQSPADARSCGIAFIQQEVQLFGNLTIYENIFLVNLKKYRKNRHLPILNKKKLVSQARDLLEQLGCTINPGAKVNTLSVGDQQMVQIARALSLGGVYCCLTSPRPRSR
jgi:ABC-type sugar transport system ATPase subunit